MSIGLPCNVLVKIEPFSKEKEIVDISFKEFYEHEFRRNEAGVFLSHDKLKDLMREVFASGLTWDVIEGHDLAIVPDGWNEMVNRNFEILYQEKIAKESY